MSVGSKVQFLIKIIRRILEKKMSVKHLLSGFLVGSVQHRSVVIVSDDPVHCRFES